MKYADVKLREEEQRATKYLESCSGSVQNLTDSCVAVLVTAFKDTILAGGLLFIERAIVPT